MTIYMDPKYDTALLAIPRFAHLPENHFTDTAQARSLNAIEKLFNFARLAVAAYDLNLSRKCFALASDLLHHGDKKVRCAAERSFVSAFSSFGRKDDLEHKRLKFFLPADFYKIFTSRIIYRESQKVTKTESITCRLANAADAVFAIDITDEMCASAKARGCGISRRRPADIIEKMAEGKAIIAVTSGREWAGFSYIETYDNQTYVSNSGLIISPGYRQNGIAKQIKKMIFEHSRSLYPQAKIFSITTGSAVMKMNSQLGFVPVTYGELTKEERFWKGCESCVNYQTLLDKNCKNCFCTAMLFDPMAHQDS